MSTEGFVGIVRPVDFTLKGGPKENVKRKGDVMGQVVAILGMDCRGQGRSRDQQTLALIEVGGMVAHTWVVAVEEWRSGWILGLRSGLEPIGQPSAIYCDMGKKVLVTQWCPTLYDPMDSSLPGFSIRGIFQARILEWIAIPFSR